MTSSCWFSNSPREQLQLSLETGNTLEEHLETLPGFQWLRHFCYFTSFECVCTVVWCPIVRIHSIYRKHLALTEKHTLKSAPDQSVGSLLDVWRLWVFVLTSDNRKNELQNTALESILFLWRYALKTATIFLHLVLRGQKCSGTTNLLSDLIHPVGCTVAQIWAFWVPGPSGENT